MNVFCFAERPLAEQFQKRCGGEFIDPRIGRGGPDDERSSNLSNSFCVCKRLAHCLRLHSKLIQRLH